MKSNLQLENIEKAFFSDGYQLGMRTAKEGMSRASINAAVHEMYASTDVLIESLVKLAEQHGQILDCKKGCEWCCHQPVFALDYELEFLNSYLNENFSNGEREKIGFRAKKKKQKLDGLDKDTLLNSKFPCPLLEKGVCVAYQARPMACRIYLSSNVKTCLHFYHKPDDEQNYPALLEFPMRAGRMMNEGFKAALKTNGIVPKEFRIEEKLAFLQLNI